MPEYTWRDGARLQKGASVPAQRVGDHLELLRDRNGGELTPDQVVDDASDPTSPLNPLFEWSDTEAAHQYRLHQARQIIRSVIIRYRETGGGPARTTHAFVHITADSRQPFYTNSAVAMADPALRAKAIRQAWNELQAFRRRYQELIEFGQVFATLDQLEQTLPPLIAA